jgi:hypothetical protein
MKIEHLLVDSTITEKRRGNWNKQASYDAGQKGEIGAGMLAAMDQRANELPDTKLTPRQEKIKQKSTANYNRLASQGAAQSAAGAPPQSQAVTPPAQQTNAAPPAANGASNLPATTQQPPAAATSTAVTTPSPVNLTATPAANGASNLPATTQQQGPEEEKPSGWERAKRFGAQAADVAGSVGRGAKAVGGAVGDVATGLGHVAGGVGNLAARTTGGIAQAVGAIGGGLKAGFKGQDYKHSGGGSYGSDQWGNTGGGGGGAPDEVDDLRATIRSMDQRLRRAGI